jgi:hypothetical protein
MQGPNTCSCQDCSFVYIWGGLREVTLKKKERNLQFLFKSRFRLILIKTGTKLHMVSEVTESYKIVFLKMQQSQFVGRYILSFVLFAFSDSESEPNKSGGRHASSQ